MAGAMRGTARVRRLTGATRYLASTKEFFRVFAGHGHEVGANQNFSGDPPAGNARRYWLALPRMRARRLSNR